MVSRRFISRDAAPSDQFVTASVHFSLPLEETKHDLLVELYAMRFNELVSRLDLPLPEIVHGNRCTDITLLLPSHSSQIVGSTCLPSLVPNPTVPLDIDIMLNEEGTYEVRQRAKGIDGRERRQMFAVERVND